jgi:adenylylsulfate kinase-like enzyme
MSYSRWHQIVSSKVQVAMSRLSELARRTTVAVRIEGAVVTEIAIVVVTFWAVGARTGARLVAMDGKLLRRESRAMVLVAFVSPFAVARQEIVIAEDGRLDLIKFGFIGELGG